MKCFGVVAIDCFIQNTLLVSGVIFPYITTVNFHMYMIAFICLFTQLLHKYFRRLSVVSDFCDPHGLQHVRPPCPSPTPRAYSNSSALSQWCHPTISSAVIPFSSQLQSLPASKSFQMRQFFASGGQCIGVSASTSVLPMNIQDWFPLGWIGWISLQSKGLSGVFSWYHSSKVSILRCLVLFLVQLSHPYVTARNTIALTRRTFVGKVMSLLFNKLSGLIITFLPRSKHLLTPTVC